MGPPPPPLPSLGDPPPYAVDTFPRSVRPPNRRGNVSTTRKTRNDDFSICVHDFLIAVHVFMILHLSFSVPLSASLSLSLGHPRKAGSEGYFKKLSKPLFHWDHRHPLGPKQLLFYDFLKKCAAGAL